jgi:predicted adenine nucleotide alpha hydrolase (AANH) superfamily ATPase
MTMRMLLHICCGPCACGAIPFWQGKVTELVGFFYNPNIHPLLEYRRRLEGATETAELSRAALVVDQTYDPEAWFATVSGEVGSRCERCIGMRMDRAAQEAVSLGCDAFSSSLSISPWQDQAAIRSRGELAGETYGVDFLYEDLRPEYSASRQLSRERGLYRQKYCGCLVSEWERYSDR